MNYNEFKKELSIELSNIGINIEELLEEQIFELYDSWRDPIEAAHYILECKLF